MLAIASEVILIKLGDKLGFLFHLIKSRSMSQDESFLVSSINFNETPPTDLSFCAKKMSLYEHDQNVNLV